MNRKHGFTLVEMLIVMAIFGALAAALVPVVLGARGSARTIVCATHMQQIYTAMEGYYTTHRYLPMDSVVDAVGAKWDQKQTNSLWTGAFKAKRGLGTLLTQYVEEPDIFFEKEATWALMDGPSGWKAPDGTLNWQNDNANVLSSYVYRQNFGKRAEKENAGVAHALVTEYTDLGLARYNHGARGAHVLYADGGVRWKSFDPGAPDLLQYDWYALEAVDPGTGLSGWESYLDNLK